MVGPLLGQPFSVEQQAADNNDGGPANRGELLIAIDPVRLASGESALDHAEKLFAALLAQPGTRLPAERRYKFRARMRPPASKSPTRCTTPSRRSASALPFY